MFKLIKGKSQKERLWQDFENEAIPFSADLFRVAMFLKRERDAAEDKCGGNLRELPPLAK